MINSKWFSSDGDIFNLDQMKTIDNETWVYYSNLSTNKTYNCLLQAFEDRFLLIQYLDENAT